MSVLHHPSDDVLLDHVRGCLPAGRVVRAHVELCPRCRRTEQVLTELAGEALAAMEPAPIDPGLLQRTLSAIAALDAEPTAAVPDKLATAAPASALPPGFKPWRWVGPGIRLADSLSPAEDGWRAFLLKVEPNRSLPAHGHEGDELTCVLQGGFTDGEHTYWKGDFAEAAGASPHRLTAMDGEACICIVATQAPLKWCGMTRWLQPIIGV